MDLEGFNQELLHFLQQSPTPFHATRTMADTFREAGFEQLAEAAKSGPHPPLEALRGSNQCASCGFRTQCYTDSGEISLLSLLPQAIAHSHYG